VLTSWRDPPDYPLSRVVEKYTQGEGMDASNAPGPGDRPNSSYNVLVVEDELGMRSFLSDYLRDCEGYTVFEASDGLDALERVLPAQRVDLVLSDINMPRMKGFDLLKTVREKYPATKRVLITAYNVEDYLDLAIKHGVGNVLVKTVPPNTKELSVVISSLLRGDIYGLEKYFAPGTAKQIFRVRRGDGLEDEVHRITAGLPQAFRTDRLKLVLLEMLTNAIFYGIRKESAQNRQEWEYSFELTPQEAITVSVMQDEGKCALSVVDNGGRLKKADVLYWLYRQLTHGENEEPIGIYDTHGRGFLIARKYVDRVVVNIERGKRTEVILMNYLEGAGISYKPLYINEL
jgi:CheY-like chemotaxis protein